jgi:hypothetical protein
MKNDGGHVAAVFMFAVALGEEGGRATGEGRRQLGAGGAAGLGL